MIRHPCMGGCLLRRPSYFNQDFLTSQWLKFLTTHSMMAPSVSVHLHLTIFHETILNLAYLINTLGYAFIDGIFSGQWLSSSTTTTVNDSWQLTLAIDLLVSEIHSLDSSFSLLLGIFMYMFKTLYNYLSHLLSGLGVFRWVEELSGSKLFRCDRGKIHDMMLRQHVTAYKCVIFFPCPLTWTI